jgi:cytidine deaminase
MTTIKQRQIEMLYGAAIAARERAYAPYSKCLVGAAILTKKGGIYAGCNVENASYGATLCAERMAIGAAVASEGALQIVAVLVVTDAEIPWPPCGMCRQVIAEFNAECEIICANLQGAMRRTSFAELYPQAFGGEFLSVAE